MLQSYIDKTANDSILGCQVDMRSSKVDLVELKLLQAEPELIILNFSWNQIMTAIKRQWNDGVRQGIPMTVYRACGSACARYHGRNGNRYFFITNFFLPFTM